MLSEKVVACAEALAKKSYNNNFSLALDKLAEKGIRKQKKDEPHVQ